MASHLPEINYWLLWVFFSNLVNDSNPDSSLLPNDSCDSSPKEVSHLQAYSMGKLGGPYVGLGNFDDLFSQFQFPYTLY